MQAIRVHEFGPPSVMKYEDVATPAPGPGQVLVRIGAAGVNPVDTYIRLGGYGTPPKLPYTPGMDAAGTVEAVGEGVTVPVGRRVYLMRSLSGTYATHALADASLLGHLPDPIPFEQGACLYVPYFTAYLAAFDRGGVRPGDTVLIHGATGGVGLATVQWLRGTGIKLLATGGSAEGLDLLRAQGVEHVFDHKSPGYLDQIRAAAPGGVHVVLEMLANVNLDADLGLLAFGGRVVVIGSRGPVTINPRLTMGKEADIRGMSLFNITAPQRARVQAAVTFGLTEGRLSPVVAHTFPLAQAPSAHDRVLQPGATGNIVLVP